MVLVGDLLQARALGLSAVEVGRPDAAVRWVATSELADPGPFLEGGEILLTTGLETGAWHGQWDSYVRRLADAGVAGIGFAVGLTHAETPAELVEACRRHQVNLFEVPRPTTFVAISRYVAHLLEEQESTATRESLKTQRKLISAAAKPDPAVAVITALAAALDGATCLMNPDGRVLTGPVGARRSELPLDEVADDVRRLHAHGLRSAAAQSNPTLSVSVHPIGLRGRASAYLAALMPARASEEHRQAVTTAVALLGLIDEQDRSRATTRRHLRSRALELLAESDVRTAQLVLEVDQTATVLPKRIRFLRAAGDESSIDNAVASLERRGVLAGVYAGELCAITEPSRAESTASRLIEDGLHVGIGNSVAPSDGETGYRTAGLALGQATDGSGAVVWDRVIGNGPLGLIDPDKAAAFAESWLHGLDSEQLETLRCFLRHHGSRLKVAEELGLHRNTVRNRLAAIESALPGKLDDPQTRVSAWIALQSVPENVRP
ncbi:PucR family transcriptional regulator [Mycolicibacterium fortuitum]|uniref:Purine catabolism PurC-like protein n=2 Tax=Mycolicibacterium fortuitum TaxID=1766 RepID=A0A1A2F147_MYCFO|nr:PucR family transcriptional regulator [Mycolicibacterium fortuitum]AIY44688.1 Cys-tRNA(Pro) deacylase YbaK [Mycobacterium sp. VKM Ac-1817D]CRL82563.1 Fis family transcriptional regulator [Mycolicibacter nonchromogenicus]EJZ08812.1 Fis family transcriptional regulator [Mycolicibacterium fortuitum subsp. fortuitum DSM 46621 = ATCC 6841 = JCM 6387]MCA4724099.1 PucR family transcriptional regulator [Mycolicibacterium fortuitum]OBB38960.1 Fis family transcriptional regulator [Mycolicibacterium f